MTPHEHETLYAERMAGGMSEKLFFMPFIPADAVILDYGCGPGDVAAAITKARPDVSVIGYDAHPGRIRTASRVGALFFSDESKAMRNVERLAADRPTALLLSSVAHEVASFMGLCELSRVLGLSARFDFLAYRDMSFNRQAFHTPDEAPVTTPEWALDSFSSRWGAPRNAASVAHLMLKARYLDNWEAENRENYAAAPKEFVLGEVSKSHFTMCFSSHGTPDFLANDLKGRFGRGTLVDTHLSFVSRRS